MTKEKFVVGLTGGIGSGKTTVANLFSAQGIELVDADVVAREVVAKGSDGLSEVVEHFGENILLENGELNREALRERIFNYPEKRQWLNQCLHPKIRIRMLELIKYSTTEYTVLVVPLLFENGLDSLVNRTLLVDIPVELQIERTLSRDGVSERQIRTIIGSQMSREDRLAKADDVICNQGEIGKLEQAVLALHQKYLTLIKKANT